MPNEEIEFGGHEYRSQGGEVQRRPAERQGLSVWDAAWLVIPKEDRKKELPPEVYMHFAQAQDIHSPNFGQF